MKSIRGFTIVELLIVIVVIGILATITIVAFRGIQDRAYNSATSLDVRGYTQYIEQYFGRTSTFPPRPTPDGWGCLGTAAQYPATAHLAAGECFRNNNSWTVAGTQAFTNALDNIVGNGSSPNTIYNYELFTNNAGSYSRGVMVYVYQPTNTLQISYVLKGDNQVCRDGSTPDSGAKDSFTFCLENIRK